MSDAISQTAAVALTEDLEDLYEDAPCGYLSFQSDGRIIKANRTLAQWLEMAPASLLEKSLHDLLSFPSRIMFETHFSPTLRMQGRFDEIALDLVTSAGDKLAVLASAVERRDADGAPVFTRLTVLKASERRRYERELIEARAATQQLLAAEQETAQLREQFIAVLGHDLRNPLAAISGCAMMLRREPHSEKGEKLLAMMDGSVVRMVGLIDNVLDLARGRLGGGITLSHGADAPLQPVLEQVVSELRVIGAGREIRTRFDLRAPVACDHARIGQLLSNLLGNALTHGAPEEPVRVTAETNGGRFLLSVANGGKAIPPEAMARLFQPFFRGKTQPAQQGLGLGLHIATEIAKAHDGTLTVDSSDTETRFTLDMPLVPGPAAV